MQGTVPEVDVSRSEFTEADIPVGVGDVSKTSGGKQMQYHFNVLVMGLEGSGWLQQEHQHSELNCLSHTRMHQEGLTPVQEYLIGDEV